MSIEIIFNLLIRWYAYLSNLVFMGAGTLAFSFICRFSRFACSSTHSLAHSRTHSKCATAAHSFVRSFAQSQLGRERSHEYLTGARKARTDRVWSERERGRPKLVLLYLARESESEGERASERASRSATFGVRACVKFSRGRKVPTP